MNFYRNKKGQALIEFLLLLPVIIFMIFVMIDVGKMVIVRNELESKIGEFVSDYKKGKTIEVLKQSLSKDENLEILSKEDQVQFQLQKEITYLTPGISKVFPNSIVIERNIIYEP